MPLSIYLCCFSVAAFSFSVLAQLAPESAPPVTATDEKTSLSSLPIAPPSRPVVDSNTLDSKAQTYLRNLPKTAAVSPQKKAEIEKRKANEGPAEIQKLEEIKVRDRLDPEDYVAPKTPPMLVFRAKLEQQRPMTPQEITKLALCFIALCAVDTSKELKLDDRNEARAKDPPSFIFR